jgi:hypothetical protein
VTSRPLAEAVVALASNSDDEETPALRHSCDPPCIKKAEARTAGEILRAILARIERGELTAAGRVRVMALEAALGPRRHAQQRSKRKNLTALASDLVFEIR